MNRENRLLVSYFTLRKLIGWMAILVPFILALLNWILFRGGLGSSVSSYYHTNVRRVFVGTLCSIGVFLLAYKGYKRLDTDKIYQFSDNIVANLAGVFTIGVALFPSAPMEPSKNDEIIAIVHVVFSAFFLFTKTHPPNVTHPFTDEDQRIAHLRKKKQRNLAYRISGIVIVLCIALMGVNTLLGNALQAIRPVFWLEALAVSTFGFSWLVKGQALLRDPKEIIEGASEGSSSEE